MPIQNVFADAAPRVQSPIEVQNGLAQGALAQGQLAHNALQVQQMQNDMADSDALRAAYRGGADPSTPQGRQALIQAAPLQAPKIFQQQADLQKSQAETEKFKGQGAEANAKAAQSKIEMNAAKLFSVNTADGAHQWIDAAVQRGDITPEAGQAEHQQVPTDPGQLAQWKQSKMLEAVKVHDYMTLQQKQAADAETARHNRTDETNSVANNAATNATHVQVANIQQRGENARHGDTISNQRLLAGLNPDGTTKIATGPDGQVDLKTVAPEDLAAAYRYKTDGTLPPNMGRGQQGAMESRKLRAIAAAIDAQAGESPEDARIRQLAAKGDVAAINQMRKREVQIGANVKNFDFNADQALQLSQKVDRTGVPIFNAWINAGRRTVANNPELAAFDTAVKTTVNEFAQIVGGTTAGASTEGEKKKAEALLNAQQTPEAFIATINQMRVESQNRIKSFKDQRAESMPTNAPRQAGASPAPAGLPSGWKIEKVGN